MADLNELKLEHYRQRVLQQEDQIATLRAELTQALEQLRVDGPAVQAPFTVTDEVVQGEVENPDDSS